MKLLVCTKCSDVFSLRVGKDRQCECGESSGYYLEDSSGHADIKGPCIPLGFRNDSFVAALIAHAKTGVGIDFTAFAIAKDCKSVTHIGDRD